MTIDQLFGIIFVILGTVMAFFNKYLSRYAIDEQNRVWGFKFGEREIKITRPFILIGGILFSAIGISTFFGLKTNGGDVYISNEEFAQNQIIGGILVLIGVSLSIFRRKVNDWIARSTQADLSPSTNFGNKIREFSIWIVGAVLFVFGMLLLTQEFRFS